MPCSCVPAYWSNVVRLIMCPCIGQMFKLLKRIEIIQHGNRLFVRIFRYNYKLIRWFRVYLPLRSYVSVK